MPRRRRIGEQMVLAAGEVLRGRQQYRVQEYVGRGGFAAGYRVEDEQGETRFLKEFLPPDSPRERPERDLLYERERRILREIGAHELCPTLYDAFAVEGLRYLVLEYIPGEDLGERLAAGRRVSEEWLLRWSVSLCSILAHLHARGIVHQDLKPRNIRLNEDDDPVLIDFGAARRLWDAAEGADAGYGTDGYLPPELSAGAAAGMQRDVFALGRVILEMMVGARLTQEQIFDRRESLCGELLHSRTLPAEFARAVMRAVAYDPTRRYSSAREMLQDLLSIAPPMGRARPRALDFGLVSGIAPRRLELHCFNVGGGLLEAEVTADVDWLEVNASGGASVRTSRFRRNRQVVMVTARPERIATRGLPVEGRVRVRFPDREVVVPCRLVRQAGAVHVTPAVTRLQLARNAIGWAEARVLFRNTGESAAVVKWAVPGFDASVEPGAALMDEGSEAVVTVAVNTRGLSEGELHFPLEWHVNDQRQTPIHLELVPRRGWKLFPALRRRGS